MQFPSSIVLGLGRDVFSVSVAPQRGITTILEEPPPHLRKGAVVVSLQQREEYLHLISFRVETGADNGASSPEAGASPWVGITGASSLGIA